jgi:outer membrane protein
MRQFFVRFAQTLGSMTAGVLLTAVSASAQDRPVSVTLSTAIEQAAAQQPPPAPAAATGSARRLTIDEAVKLALEQNLSLQVQRLNPQIQDLSVAQVRTVWTPSVASSFNTSSAQLAPTSPFEPSTSDTTNVNMQALQLFPWGGSYNVTWLNTRRSNNSAYSIQNPLLQSTVQANYTQPLLQNFKIDNARQQLLVAKKNREISDVDLKESVLTTVRNVKNAYWDLSYAVASLAVQKQSLDLARESLRNNRTRVEVGTMAPIDIVEAEAEVANREESVILAEAAISQAEDRLRALILDPRAADFWTTRFELTDAPATELTAVDADAAVRNALSKRTDLEAAKKTLEASDINIKYFRNQVLPQVNANVNYTLTGSGGTLHRIDQTTDPVTVSIVGQTSYGSVLNTILKNDLPTWTAGITVSYPIGRSTAEANLARSRLQYQQSQVQLRNLELQVVTQVRDAARNVNTNQKRVEASRVSRQLAERRLEAEEKKFAAGMQTSFFVFQAQRDLALARNNELRAILDYSKSVIDFETTQEAPLGGGGGIVLAGAGGTGTGVTQGGR